MRWPLIILGLVLLAGALALAWQRFAQPRPLDQAATEALYQAPLPPWQGEMQVFHLGHSLVGHDVPAMLAQLAGAAHGYAFQLGWGTPMKAHWEPEMEIVGFDEANAFPQFQPAKEALAGGTFDALVVTEMIDIKTSIKHHAAATYLNEWAGLARAGNPDIRVYLYETWPWISVKDGWLNRLDTDLQRHWIDGVLRPALAMEETPAPVYLIPGGQVFAAFTRRIEGADGVEGFTDRTDLFKKNPDGTQDTIHFNDAGAYLIALTHFAVLYGKSPVGLPQALMRADGTPMAQLSPEAARIMQETVWEVVSRMPMTGVGATQLSEKGSSHGG